MRSVLECVVEAELFPPGVSLPLPGVPLPLLRAEIKSPIFSSPSCLSALKSVMYVELTSVNSVVNTISSVNETNCETYTKHPFDHVQQLRLHWRQESNCLPSIQKPLP